MGEEYSNDIETIINIRIKIYNSLSNDALTILSIQLFVFPLLISAVSLINELVKANKDSTSGGISEQLISQISGIAIFDGLIFLITEIILTTLVYYDSRRRATKQPEYMAEQEDMDFSTDNLFGSIASSYFEKERKHGTEPPTREDILQSFDREVPLGTPHRLGLLFSLLASFYSVYKVGNELFSVAYPSLNQILFTMISFAAFLVVLMIVYSPIVSIFEGGLGFMARISKTCVFILVEWIENVLILLWKIIWNQIKDGNIFVNISALTAFLLLSFGSSKFPSGYISGIHLLSLILGEMVATLAFCYILIPEPD